MLTFTPEQIQSIINLRPLIDSSFMYNADRWKGLNNNYKDLLKDFENKKNTRNDVINTFIDYYNNKCDFMKAFLLCMVWGFSDTGYGTHRTNKFIETDNNKSLIKSALDHINRNEIDSLKNAFFDLKKVDGLGISYLTKVLYFATKAMAIDNYALIFDIKVARALVKLSAPIEIFEILNIGPSSKYNDYNKYNNQIHTLAKKYDIDADKIEFYLFNLN